MAKRLKDVPVLEVREGDETESGEVTRVENEDGRVQIFIDHEKYPDVYDVEASIEVYR
jgi:hypothetical protein